MGCEVLALTPIKLTPENILETNAEIESNIGVWNSAATYSIGQPSILGAVIWASKEDANINNKPYTDVGNYLALDSSVRRYTYVTWWRDYINYQVGQVANSYEPYGATVGSNYLQYKSITGGINKALPAGMVDNADWEYIGLRSSYFNTRTDIENGGDVGEHFWDASQNKGFILIAVLAADPTNYFPLIDSSTQSQITSESKWSYVRDVNPYLIFDGSPSSQTERTENLYYELKIDEPFTDIVCMNAEGNEIQVIVKDQDTQVEIVNETLELRRRHSSPYTLFYNYRDKEPDLYLKDLPVGVASTIEININANVDAKAKIGGLYIGTAFSIGNAKYTPRVGTYVYKQSETNDFIADSIKRVVSRTVKFAEFPVTARQSQHDEMVRRLDGITDAGGDDRPSVFMGLRDDYVSFSLLGYLERHSQGLGASATDNNIRIEGVR